MDTKMMTNKTVTKLIQKSGNNFHALALRNLEKRGWKCLVSPYYTDNITDKPREIDLIAEKIYPLRSLWRQSTGGIRIRLFIECKYSSKNTVFWFHSKDRGKAELLVVGSTPLRSENIYTKKHHYLSENSTVAKLFNSESTNEDVHKGLTQCLHSMISLKNNDDLFFSRSHNSGLEIIETVHYPIIIFNSFDKFFRVDMGDEEKSHVKISDNFLFELNYAYVDKNKNQVNKYFLVDIIDFHQLDEFLKIIDEDVKNMRVLLESNIEVS